MEISSTYVDLSDGWEGKEYEITLDNNGATTEGYTSAKIAYATKVLTFTGEDNPIKTGYEFMGWYYDNELVIKADKTLAPITQFTNGSGWLDFDDVTLTAKWNKICTITLNDGGATTPGYTSATVTQNKNILTYVGEDTLDKTSCTFMGWYSSSDELIIDTNGKLVANTAYTNLSGMFTYNDDVTLFAKWQSKGNIVLSTDAGTLVSTNAKVALNSNKISEIANPIRNDYAFMGWYHSEELIIDISGSLCPNTTYTDANGCWLTSNEITLKASWQEGTTDLSYTPIIVDEVTVAYSVSQGTTTATEIVIPDYHEGCPITTLLANAFTSASITGLYIPYTVETIALGTLRGCSGLVSLTLPFIGASRTTTGYRYPLGYIFGNASYTGSTSKRQYYYYNNDYITSAYYYIPNALKEINVTDIEYLNYGSFYYLQTITKVTLPNSLKTICPNAFYYCQKLESVNIPYNVTTLPANTFQYCNVLKEIVLPNSLTTIGQNCFYSCYALTELTIPDELKNIEANAFASCSSLKDVYVSDLAKWMNIDFVYASSNPLNYTGGNKSETLYVYNKTKSKYEAVINLVIPSNITTIKAYTFYNIPTIESVTVHENVTSIGAQAFNNCISIEKTYIKDINSWVSINFADQYANPIYRSRSFDLYNSEKGEYEVVSDITFNNEITQIKPYAFYNCYNLKKVTIPDNIESIGQYAFYYCYYINELKCSFNANLSYIGQYAFAQNYLLKNVTISNNLKIVDDEAFAPYSNYTTLRNVYVDDIDKFSMIQFKSYNSNPSGSGLSSLYKYNHETDKNERINNVVLNNNNEYIGAYVFYNYTNITTVNVPNKAKYIGRYAFRGATSLTTISINGTSELTSIGASAFQGCTKLANIVLPNTLAVIDSYAFYACKSLTELVIPSNVEAICSYAFSDCKGITEFTIPKKVKTLDAGTFASCSALESIIFEEGSELTSIGQECFNYCSRLANISIPSSVTSIGSKAFQYCSSLKEIVLPDSITMISQYLFQNCNVLEKVNIPQKASYIDMYAFSGCSKLTSINIPKLVARIYDGDLHKCVSLKDVTFEDESKLLYIQNNAFEYCNSIVELNLPYGLLGIYQYAFQYNTNLVRVCIPVTVTSIGNNAFLGCDKLVQIKNDTNFDLTKYGLTDNKGMEVIKNEQEFTNIIETDENGVVIYATDDAKYIIGYVGDAEFLDLSAYSDISAIYPSAFKNCTSLKKVYVPKNIDSIGFGAFNGCSNLEELILPYIGASKYATAENALFGHIFGTTSYNGAYGAYQYYSSSSSKYIYLPTKLVKVTIMDDNNVGYGAFSNCERIKTIILNNEVSEIGEKVFYYCDDLETVDLSNTTITEIKDGTFSNCINLKSVLMPNSVVKIGNNVFEYCKSLISITLPEGLEVLGNSAFASCTSLASIVIPDGIEVINDSTFSSCTSLASITLPANLREIGSSAFRYCGFTSINLPSSLEIIKSYAFEYAKLTSITIPEKITILNNNTFAYCFNLVNVNFASDENLKEIMYYAFEYCYALRSIELPSSLEILDNSVFYYCYNLSEVNIPEGIKELESSTFGYCYSLAQITIPSSMEIVNSETFYYCYNLYQIRNLSNIDILITSYNDKLEIVGEDEEFVNKITTENGVVLLKDNTIDPLNPTIYIIDYAGNGNTIDLTDCAGTIIAPYAFFMKANVKTVIVPNTVKEIGYASFGGCYRLENITLPFVGSNVYAKNTEDAVFGHIFGNVYVNEFYNYFNSNSQYYSQNGYTYSYRPNSLKNIKITDALEISYGAFSYVYVENIYLNCTKINERAFYNTYNSISVDGTYQYIGLKNVTLSNNVTRIEKEAFCYAELLESVIFEENSKLEYIGPNAFYYCYYSEWKNDEYIYHGLKSINIPKGVKEIDDYAFYYCEMLGEVTFEDDSELERIGKNAFYNCAYMNSSNNKLVKYGIESIVIPKGVKEIDDYAFAYCYILGNVTFEEDSKLERIGKSSFYGCNYSYTPEEEETLTYGLKQIVLPEGLKIIDESAFASCSYLKSISIPSSIEEISSSCFNYCNSLEFYNEGGINYLGNSTNHYIVAYSVSDDTLEEYVINDNTKIIMPGIFSGCAKLKKITVPFIGINREESDSENAMLGYFFSKGTDVVEGYTIVEQSYDSSQIIPYLFPTSLNTVIVTDATQLSYGAFSNCSNLTKIIIPETVEKVSANVFIGCEKDLEIFTTSNNIIYLGNASNPYHVAYEVVDKTLSEYSLNANTKVIGGLLFFECKYLSGFNIPEGVVSIGFGAFADSMLSEIVFPSTLKYIGESAFTGCDLTSITLPDGLLEIGMGAFAGTKITFISIPQNVRILENASFAGIQNLKTVTFTSNSKLEKINESCFASSGLEEIVLPEGLLTIGNSAFAGSKLVNITIPSSVTTIGDSAFSGCLNLKKVTIGDNSKLKEIGNMVFAGSTLEEIDFGANSSIERLCTNSFAGTKLASIVIPSSVSIIDNGVFATCTGLKSIVLADNSKLMELCNGVFSGLTSLETFSFGQNSSITKIGAGAFSASGITRITIPKQVITIGEAVFSNCSNLEEVIFEEGSIISKFENYLFASSKITSITVPRSVTNIYKGVFQNCLFLQSVVFADNSKLTYLYQDTFKNLTALKSVSFGKNSVLSSLSAGTFASSAIEKIVIPKSISNISSDAFMGCSRLTEVIFENNSRLSYLNNGLFADLAALISVDFGKSSSLYSIYEGAFKNTAITSIVIPKWVNSIGNNAFKGCIYLESITFEEDSVLTSIGDNAFEGCSSLVSIIIPDDTHTIGVEAFKGCTNLVSITFEDTANKWYYYDTTGTINVVIDNSNANDNATLFKQTAVSYWFARKQYTLTVSCLCNEAPLAGKLRDVTGNNDYEINSASCFSNNSLVFNDDNTFTMDNGRGYVRVIKLPEIEGYEIESVNEVTKLTDDLLLVVYYKLK